MTPHEAKRIIDLCLDLVALGVPPDAVREIVWWALERMPLGIKET